MGIEERSRYEAEIAKLEDQRAWLIIGLILLVNTILIHQILSMLGWLG